MKKNSVTLTDKKRKEEMLSGSSNERVYEVLVPERLHAGDSFYCMVSGVSYRVMIPDGVKGGDTLAVSTGVERATDVSLIRTTFDSLGVVQIICGAADTEYDVIIEMSVVSINLINVIFFISLPLN